MSFGYFTAAPTFAADIAFLVRFFQYANLRAIQLIIVLDGKRSIKRDQKFTVTQTSHDEYKGLF